MGSGESFGHVEVGSLHWKPSYSSAAYCVPACHRLDSAMAAPPGWRPAGGRRALKLGQRQEPTALRSSPSPGGPSPLQDAHLSLQSVAKVNATELEGDRGDFNRSCSLPQRSGWRKSGMPPPDRARGRHTSGLPTWPALCSQSAANISSAVRLNHQSQ